MLSDYYDIQKPLIKAIIISLKTILSAFRLRHESFCFRIEPVACFRRFSVVFGEAGRVERTPHPEAIKASP